MQLSTTPFGADADGVLSYNAIGSLTDSYPLSVAGEGRRGGCKFLLDKCVDQRGDVAKFCFGSLPSDGLKRGNAQTGAAGAVLPVRPRSGGPPRAC